jgi:hypothetical protein
MLLFVNSSNEGGQVGNEIASTSIRWITPNYIAEVALTPYYNLVLNKGQKYWFTVKDALWLVNNTGQQAEVSGEEGFFRQTAPYEDVARAMKIYGSVINSETPPPAGLDQALRIDDGSTSPGVSLNAPGSSTPEPATVIPMGTALLVVVGFAAANRALLRSIPSLNPVTAQPPTVPKTAPQP